MMTREAYRRNRNRKRRLKKKIKNLPNDILVNSGYLLIGCIYELYLIVKLINKIALKIYAKLPEILRIGIVYMMIVLSILQIKTFINEPENKVKEVAVINEIEKAKEETEDSFDEKLCGLDSVTCKNEEIEEVIETEECKFDEVSCKIYNKAKELEMDEEHILISIAISKWETGNYTSEAYKNFNNVGGMMCQSGLIKYGSLDEGIEKFLTNLRDNYFGIGLNTIEKIQPKYCPIGAANDPNGLNKYWLSGVTKMYNELKG